MKPITKLSLLQSSKFEQPSQEVQDWGQCWAAVPDRGGGTAQGCQRGSSGRGWVWKLEATLGLEVISMVGRNEKKDGILESNLC